MRAPLFILTIAFMMLGRAVVFWPMPTDQTGTRWKWAALAWLALAAGLFGAGAGVITLLGLLPTVPDPVSFGVVGVFALTSLVTLANPRRMV